MEPPAKKPRKLLDDDSSSDSGDESGGVPISNQSEPAFKINEDYARRFEHNKKREELQKLESKLGKTSALGKRRDRDEDDSDGSEESSSDEEEDEDGELVTPAVDAEIMATLNAIRSKDPRVYDKDAKFYTALEEEENSNTGNTEEKQKPMTLRDYHRQNLLSGANLEEDDTSDAPKTYAQEQEELKNAIVKEMHATADQPGVDEDKDEDGGFLIRKSTTKSASEPKEEIKLDVENADKDPETFLSNFLSSRAWIPAGRSELQPFESDDDEEEERAEAFEEAYNFRFEDPNKLNATLLTHARDKTNQQSVRREEKSARKKLREAERMRKEEEKKQREAEKSRLRKLKMEELQEKVNKIKEVAGFRASKFTDDDWAHFLDDAWDDDKWEKEMQKRFGEDYYADEDAAGSDGESKGKKKRPKKPTWDDDIDIKDLVPDFDEEEPKPALEDSDIEMEDDAEDTNKKSKAQERRDQKREARKDRLRIEEAVDRNLDLDIALLPGATKKNTTRFRYRETSPQSFGLTARDILMADDAQLNQFAGLKKLASFRDPEKKRKDQKNLGKKARLRQWRKETFGNEDGPVFSFGGEKPAGNAEQADDGDKVDIREGEPRRKKRKRSKKH
ncbi:KRRI-interacting protein 1 [Aspergillus pseudoviridinutans]|uniref:KRRI-interacting protein 1 n=1 Tax=Aspergillus pseudoviridinutans TaxID=1517512 RepID=A0A9P3B457_9EURO|nr:KRRI-interacting protein 1 [Aspergillus pseudoviridinutans]GIJ84376.1 KRRI-interacting protein 1 [Aspergillus pseudoviridinutans]